MFILEPWLILTMALLNFQSYHSAGSINFQNHKLKSIDLTCSDL